MLLFCRDLIQSQEVGDKLESKQGKPDGQGHLGYEQRDTECADRQHVKPIRIQSHFKAGDQEYQTKQQAQQRNNQLEELVGFGRQIADDQIDADVFASGQSGRKAQKGADQNQVYRSFIDPLGGGIEDEPQHYFITDDDGGHEDTNPRDNTTGTTE